MFKNVVTIGRRMEGQGSGGRAAEESGVTGEAKAKQKFL